LAAERPGRDARWTRSYVRLSALMLDAGDFAGATSSATTKIIHGGVRYLEEAIQDLDPKEYHVVVRRD
jgi:glycerol-3-phosphate dehydrogenase